MVHATGITKEQMRFEAAQLSAYEDPFELTEVPELEPPSIAQILGSTAPLAGSTKCIWQVKRLAWTDVAPQDVSCCTRGNGHGHARTHACNNAVLISIPSHACSLRPDHCTDIVVAFTHVHICTRARVHIYACMRP